MLEGALDVILASLFELLIQALSVHVKTSIGHFWWKSNDNSRMCRSSLLLLSGQ